MPAVIDYILLGVVLNGWRMEDVVLEAVCQIPEADAVVCKAPVYSRLLTV